MKKKYDSDIKNNVNKLLDRIIIVLIVLIVISGVFLLIRKEEYNKTVIEVNDSKLSVGAVEKEISVKTICYSNFVCYICISGNY